MDVWTYLLKNAKQDFINSKLGRKRTPPFRFVKVPQVPVKVWISSEDFEAAPSVRCLGRAVKYKESLPHLPNAACVANSPENAALRGRTEAL